MNTAEKLIQLRNEKGLTQAELGKELNIALSSIQNYENVKKPRIPEAKLLLKIAKYYDVSMEYLLDDTVENRKHENINVGKDLGLNDEAIETIKYYTNDFKKYFNSFINNYATEDFLLHYFILAEFEIIESYINCYSGIACKYKKENQILSFIYYSENVKKSIEANDSEHVLEFIEKNKDVIKLIEKFTSYFMEYRYTSIPGDFFIISKNINFKEDILNCKSMLNDIENKMKNNIYNLEYKKNIEELYIKLKTYTISFESIVDKLGVYKKILKACINEDFHNLLNYDFITNDFINEIVKEYQDIKSIHTTIYDGNKIVDEQIITSDGDE